MIVNAKKLEYHSHNEQHCRELKRIASSICVLPSTYPLDHTFFWNKKLAYKKRVLGQSEN